MPPTLHPSPSLLRSTLLPQQLLQPTQQIRHASLLKRPLRPYTFTQLVALSDGSTFLTRTTSPQPVFRSAKDTANHPLWQPSLESLKNIESDEAGRLRAFRERFGRGWEAEAPVGEKKKEDAGENKGQQEEQEESLMDLISGGQAMGREMMKGVVNTRSGKEKK
ncbi:hypothetical protein CJF32_00008243 [Rutstroemia sp. NJR-2017a WRK4]|nr:hypothetical protein CJF32_00008243 [Rutstroemia sp. NJR-2017a WRK4]